jgi:hypothetical protein
MYNNQEYCSLDFNNAMGLTCYTYLSYLDKSPVLVLTHDVLVWCKDNLRDQPVLVVQKTRGFGSQAGVKVWVRFTSPTDRMLFQIRYATHFINSGQKSEVR